MSRVTVLGYGNNMGDIFLTDVKDEGKSVRRETAHSLSLGYLLITLCQSFLVFVFFFKKSLGHLTQEL